MSQQQLRNNRVIVGLSGGVDSAVAALLLQQQGYDVHGVTLKTWHIPPADGGESAEDDVDSGDQAAAVAAALHIPLTERDVEARFFRDIVQPFADAYAQGLTPNPCVMCNPGLKFAVLLEEAERTGARWIATGHYARVTHTPGEQARLLQARDRQKDQTYALYRLSQHHLTRMLLPLGEVTDKATVRDLARQARLPIAEQRESQDLCFMRGGDYRSLLDMLRPNTLQPGPILDEAGQQLGSHHGLAHYTVGQRSGLGIAAAARLYVVHLRPEDNALIVGPRSSLERQICHIEAVTFTAGEPPSGVFTAEGRIRYRAPLVPVEVSMLDHRRATIRFAQAQMGVAPGQSLVLYRGEEVLGGGIIVATQRDS